MTPTQRKAQMILSHVNVLAIARKFGVTPSAVYRIRAGKSKSRRLEEALAAACGTTRDEMFPERADRCNRPGQCDRPGRCNRPDRKAA